MLQCSPFPGTCFPETNARLASYLAVTIQAEANSCSVQLESRPPHDVCLWRGKANDVALCGVSHAELVYATKLSIKELNRCAPMLQLLPSILPPLHPSRTVLPFLTSTSTNSSIWKAGACPRY
jgi:hypothetical protein